MLRYYGDDTPPVYAALLPVLPLERALLQHVMDVALCAMLLRAIVTAMIIAPAIHLNTRARQRCDAPRAPAAIMLIMIF